MLTFMPGGSMHALEVAITPEMLVRAAKKAEDLGVIKNSILKGKGALAGFLGEEMFLEAFPQAVSSNTFDHDIICDGYRVEVKSVQTTVVPKPYFHCHVAAYNNNQDADIYVFTRIHTDFDRGWLMGWINCADWKSLARFAAKGEKDGPWAYPCDCYNLKYSELEPFTKNPDRAKRVLLK